NESVGAECLGGRHHAFPVRFNNLLNTAYQKPDFLALNIGHDDGCFGLLFFRQGWITHRSRHVDHWHGRAPERSGTDHRMMTIEKLGQSLKGQYLANVQRTDAKKPRPE